MSTDSAHALRVEVARLTKERDEARDRVSQLSSVVLDRGQQIAAERERFSAALAAANARADAAEALAEDRRKARDVQDYEAQARDLFRALSRDEARAIPMLAAALRAEREAALERAAQVADEEHAEAWKSSRAADARGDHRVGAADAYSALAAQRIAERIRALIAPAPESPPGPAAYVDALQDPVHTSPGKLLSSQPLRPPAPRLDNLAAESPAPDLRKECGDNSPEWWTGRWQDWHRGHGCSKDDGKPCTPEGVAEFAAHGRLPGRAVPAPSKEPPT